MLWNIPYRILKGNIATIIESETHYELPSSAGKHERETISTRYINRQTATPQNILQFLHFAEVAKAKS